MGSSPEILDSREKYFEKQKFRKEIEKKVKQRLSNGQENYPDIVTCPNEKCANPIKVDVQDDKVELVCGNCGWKHIIKRDKNDVRK